MEDRLREVLRTLGFADHEVQLDHAADGQVGGVLVSPRFTGHTQEERQHQLWDALRKDLRPEELEQIIAIMTMTPEEIAA